MANYKYLKENNLFEAHMRYMRALGESFAPIEEADDEQNQPQNANGADGMTGQNPMGGGDAGLNGGMPPGDPNAAGDGIQDPDSMGNDMPPTDSIGGGMADGLDEEEPEEEDDVIDVEDLTDAQEKVNDKVNSVGRDLGKVDSRIEKLIGAIETLQTMFDKNNQEIADLKTEFEKRNPTQTEKLNLRSLDSYPFKVKPTDYWKDKAETSNYSAYADNQEPTTQEYVITNDDVDDFNSNEISDTFAITDELDQNLKKIFGL